MKHEIIRWNNQFPLDRWWRLKYRISYNSKEHQSISQVDIFFEWYEESIFNESINYQKELEEKSKLFESGELLSRRSLDAKVEEDSLFDNLDLSTFNIE